MTTVLAHGGHVVPAFPVDIAALRSGVLVLVALIGGSLLLQGVYGEVVSRQSLRRLTGGALVLLVAIAGSAGTTGVFRVAAVTHSIAACLWLGAVTLIAIAPKGQRAKRTKAMRVPGVGGAALIAVSGLVQAYKDRVGLDSFAFDRLVLVKVGLLLGACALGFTLRKRLQLALLVPAAVIGGLLAAIPGPPPPGPLVTSAGDLAVTVIPQRVGENLVHVDTDQPLRIDGVLTSALPGTTGQWARISLPHGRSTVRVGTDTVLVDATPGAPNPDGPECASTLLAQQLSGKPLTDCPSTHLSRQDAQALTGLTSWLRGRGVAELQVVGDSTQRSIDAGLRVQGLRNGTHGALLLTGSWESAAKELAALDRMRVPQDGVYLAPWLLTGPILQTYATAAPLLALPFDPHSQDARAYVAKLPAGESPTGAGYEAYAATEQKVQIWATSPASTFPADLGHAHASTGGWFPGGTLAAVSRLLIT